MQAQLEAMKQAQLPNEPAKSIVRAAPLDWDQRVFPEPENQLEATMETVPAACKGTMEAAPPGS